MGIVTSWLASDHCDVLLIQETKSQDINFPTTAFEDIGWHVVFYGQAIMGYIASRHKIEDVKCGLPGDDSDEQARYMEASIYGIKFYNLFTKPAPGPKFDYKLDWLDRLEARAAKLLESEMPIVLGGTIMSFPMIEIVLTQLAGLVIVVVRKAGTFRRLIHRGYTDALRSLHPHEVFTPIGIIRPALGNAITESELIIFTFPRGARPAGESDN